MEIGETLYITDRKDWRTWLEKNYDKKNEIWLIYYKKHTNKSTILYDDAVEEALCFGWIDSTVKRIDNEKYAQRYTPRNLNSIWSQINIRRVKKMMKEGKMTKEGLLKFEYGMNNNLQAPTIKDEIMIPEDLQKAFKTNPQAKKNYHNLAQSYKLMYIHWITNAKMKETRKRRLQKAVILLNENKKSWEN